MPAAVTGTDAERSRCRDSNGRFSSKNQYAANRGFRRSIQRLAGAKGVSDPVAADLARDALRLMGASLAELPDGESPNVRAMVALWARHMALAGHFASRALEVGIETKEGADLDARATRHGERAERLLATVLAASKSLATSKVKRSASTLTLAERLGVKEDDP